MRCRGLVAAARGDVEEALALLDGAAAQHAAVGDPFGRARALLALGVTRRRARQKRPARDAIEAALAGFEEIEAAGWAQRAPRRARRDRRADAQRRPDPGRAARRRPRGGGADERGGGRDALPRRADRREPPDARVREARACARAPSSHASSDRRPQERFGGWTTVRNSTPTGRARSDAKTPEPGRPPHHDRRCRPADLDRLLGRRARDAVRVRAAEPGQRVREPPLLRSRRRAPDHGLHERGARARPDADVDGHRSASTTSRSRSRRRRSGRRSSAWTSAGSSTAASRTAASWTRSTSRTRWAC